MNLYAVYLLKVVLCSGILLGYYGLALRNRTFHQWNRFYLLGSVVLSLLAPLITIDLNFFAKPEPPTVLRMLQVVDGNAEVVVESSGPGTTLSLHQWLCIGYALVSTVLLAIISANTLRLYAILQQHAKTKIGTVYFLNTDVKGTHFSFFRYIVWNWNIDIQTETGQRILNTNWRT